MLVLGKKMIGFDEGIRVITIAFGKVILELHQELTVSTTVALMKKHSGLIEFGCRAVYIKLLLFGERCIHNTGMESFLDDIEDGLNKSESIVE